jgi:cysteine desulfurase
MEMRRVYLDHAATTSTDPRVVEAMLPYFTEEYGNASSLYTEGVKAKEALEEARKKVGALIHADPREVLFTSGGTESDNLALKGVAFAQRKKGKHILTTAIEHHAILEPCEWLAEQGFEVTYLPVDPTGLVEMDRLEEAIREDTILISVMHANNEIGTIEPIREIGALARERGIPFHTDAIQSVGKIPVDVKEMNVDLLSISGHKIYGPKGVGALYVRRGVRLTPLFHGGGHEFRKRSGTENIPGIVGLGRACEIAGEEMEAEGKRLTRLRDRLIRGVLEIPDTWLNGHPTQRLPNNANVSFKYLEGESLVLELDFHGVAVNTGSACSSKSLQPSHVLAAIGLKPEDSHGSLRFTLGRGNTEEDIDYVLEVLPKAVHRFREISPFKAGMTL